MGFKLPNSLMVVSLDAIDAFTLKPFAFPFFAGLHGAGSELLHAGVRETLIAD